MQVKVKAIERLENTDNYYIVFDYLGKERRSCITPSVLKYHHVPSFVIGMKLEVTRSFKGDKEFYNIRKVLNG